jgi:hypothetical protein
MEDQKVFVPAPQLAMYQSLSIEFANMKAALDLAESRKQEDIAQFTIMVEANIKMLQEDRKAAKNEANNEMFLEYSPTGMNPDSEVMVKLTELEATAIELKVRITRRARRYFPVHRAGVNTARVSRRTRRTRSSASRRCSTSTTRTPRASSSASTSSRRSVHLCTSLHTLNRGSLHR